MNRLFCRRRIGVIHIHRDDRCSVLSDVYSFSFQQDSQGRGLPTPFHRLFQIGKFSSHHARQYDVEMEQSLRPSQCQCHRSVTMRRPPCGFARDNPTWFRRDPQVCCIHIYNKEGSFPDNEEEDICYRSFFHLDIKLRSDTVPFCNTVLNLISC